MEKKPAHSVDHMFSLYFYFFILIISSFGFEDGIGILIAPVLVHCLFVTFVSKMIIDQLYNITVKSNNICSHENVILSFPLDDGDRILLKAKDRIAQKLLCSTHDLDTKHQR